MKSRFYSLLLKCNEFLTNFPNFESLTIYNAAKSLQSVSKMFQRLIRLEFGDVSNQSFPMAQSTPDRQTGINQTFAQFFPAGSATFSIPGNATFSIPGNDTYDISRNRLRDTFSTSRAFGNVNKTYEPPAWRPNATFAGFNTNLMNNMTSSRNVSAPQILITPPTVDEQLTNTAANLNQTVNQLNVNQTPSNRLDMTYLTVPSQTGAAINARGQTRIPIFTRGRGRAPIQRKINFSNSP